MENSDITYKVIIIGDTSVGKSCILNQLTQGKFKDEHYATIGVEFGQHEIKLEQDNIVKMQIWDTAGQECYRAITRSFYRNAGGILIVYDMTTRSSFESLPDWIGEVKQNANPDAVIFLVGNQLDKAEKNEELRQVKIEDAIELQKQYKLAGFIETSAKTSTNIEKAFYQIATELQKDHEESKRRSTIKEPAPRDSFLMRNTKMPPQKKKRCC